MCIRDRAIGAALAYPERQVVALCGDGGLSMTLGDLATVVQYKLCLLYTSTSAAYYFHAHTNETCDDKKKAIIARYTPIDVEIDLYTAVLLSLLHISVARSPKVIDKPPSPHNATTWRSG